MGVVPHGVVGGQRGERGYGGLAGVADGLGGVDGVRGAAPVVRELAYSRAGVFAAQRLERFSDLAMDAGTAGRAEILIQRVLGQRVRETPTAGNVGELADQGGRGCGVEEIEQIIGAEVGDRVEQLEVEISADDRRDGQNLARRFAEARDAGADYFAHTGWERHLREVLRRRPAASVVLGDGAGLGEVA